MNIFEAPNQTEAAKDICRHLTRREKVIATTLGGLLGLWIGAICSLVPFLIVAQLEKSLWPFLPFLAVFGFLIFKVIIKMQNIFLLKTHRAKEKNYTYQDIRKTG